MADDQDTTSSSSDLRGLLRQFVTPVIEQVEQRVSRQIDDEVAERIDELLNTRMATIDRAIGDLDRHILELQARLDRLERAGLGAPELLDDAEQLGATLDEQALDED